MRFRWCWTPNGGDISSTARAYARSAFEMLGADAITLSPYLGYDSLTPFMQDPEKGIFLLCKTSNAGSVDLQDLPLGGDYRLMMVYEKVAGMAAEWGTKGNLGLVVGATFPDALRRVRELAPEQWFLAPGLGAQGADLGAGDASRAARGWPRAADQRQPGDLPGGRSGQSRAGTGLNGSVQLKRSPVPN